MGKKNKKRKFFAPASEPVNSLEEENKSPNEADKFKLNIPDKVFEKIMYWINKASPNEVSGFGSLDFDEETREFTVRDAMLLEQEVSCGSAEIDDNSINKAMYKMRNEPNALKWHWHSHPTFDVFWSGTDEELIRQLGRKGWIVATVFNCKKEMRTAFLTSVELMGKPHDIFVDDFKTEIVIEVDEDLARRQKIYDQEFDINVKTSKWSFKDYKTKKNYDDGRREKRNYTPYLGESNGIERIWPYEYNAYGYAETRGGAFVYNPIYDCEVIGKENQYLAIEEMKEDEIEFLKERDYKFSDLYREYIKDKSYAERLTQGVET